MTEASCLSEIATYGGFAVKYFTHKQRTHAVCLAAVQDVGCAVRTLKSAERSFIICLAAVQQRAIAIAYLTAEERTPRRLPRRRASVWRRCAVVDAGAADLRDLPRRSETNFTLQAIFDGR